MRKTLLAAVTAIMLLAGVGVAQAKNDGDHGPGPNGSNEHGLCTAYFNGQKNGHDKDGDGHSNPGPFAALEDTATGGEDPPDNDDPTNGSQDEIVEAVYNYCTGFGIGGQPDHGRYTCTITTPDDPDTPENEQESECTNN